MLSADLENAEDWRNLYGGLAEPVLAVANMHMTDRKETQPTAGCMNASTETANSCTALVRSLFFKGWPDMTAQPLEIANTGIAKDQQAD